jgi:hypothetical protein
MLDMRRRSILAAVVMAVALGGIGESRAATISWKGHTWQLTSGAMAGVCDGDPQNVTIDTDGYLHLRISNNGGTWTASELFTTDRLSFGTYQWQVDGPIDTYDKNVVLGLFPYGPDAGIGADGTNEIDIEYARWGEANGPNGDWTDYPASGTTVGELSYTFSLGGSTLSTSRFVWSSTSIASTLLDDLQAVGSSTGLIKSWTYAPSTPTTNIPQQALPLGMNLWCFDAPPSDGNPVEIIIRDFVYVAPGGGSGGAGGGAAGGPGGSGGAAGGPTGSGGAAGRSGGSGGAAGRSGGSGGGLGGTGAGNGGGGVAGQGGGVVGAGGAAGGGGATGGATGTTGGATGTGGGATGTGSGGAAGATGGRGGSTAGGGGAAGVGGPVTVEPVSGTSSGCGCSLGDAPGAPFTLAWSSVAPAVLILRRRLRRRR